MRVKHWLVAAVGSMAIGFLAASAQAAPIGGLPAKSSIGAETSNVQQVQHHVRRGHHARRGHHVRRGGHHIRRGHHGRRHH